MNPQVPDELISAFFDGEVSPEERAAVERLLASSDDAQRELNETARLSALLHSFPRESAPVELVKNVLRQTNQLPLPAQSTPSIASAPTRNVGREWMAALAGVVGTIAAGLLVMAFNVDQPKDGADATVAMTEAHSRTMDSPAEAPLPMASEPAGPVALRDDRAEQRTEIAAKPISKSAEGDGVDGAHKPAGQVPEEPPSNLAMRSRSQVRKGSAPKSGDTADLGSASVADAKSQAVQSLMIDGQQLDKSDFVKGLREGKLVTISDPENNVGLLSATVVDVDKTAEMVQVVLKKNAIEPRGVNKDGTSAPGDLYVFYIVAPGDKLAKLVEDVERHRDLLTGVVVEPPLQVAAVPDETMQQMEKKDSAKKEKQVEKPGAVFDAEAPEFQVVLKAYNERNGLMNPALGNSITNSNGQFGVGREGLENLTRQPVADAVREKSKAELTLRGGNPAANQAQPGQIGRAGPGYDYARINNSIVTNSAPGAMVNNSVNPLNQTNPAQNPFHLEQNNARRQMAYSNQDKSLNNDSSRDLRVLFVLHPQAEGSQVPPATAAPAKQQ